MKKIYLITQIVAQKLSKVEAHNFRFRWMLLLSMLVFATTAQAAVFTVSNTNDSGAGSLRQAIDDANNTPGADIIEFATSGIITPQTALPNITEGLTIDGTTATGYTAGNPTITIEHTLSNYALTVSMPSGAAQRDITISGIAIQKTAGGSGGISIHGGNINIAVDNNSVIENCTFDSLSEGVRINGSNDQTIRDNAFIGTGTLGSGNHSVELIGSSTDLLSMSGNTFAGGGNGIFIAGIDNITVGPGAANAIQLLATDNIQSLNGVPFIIQNVSNITFDDISAHPITTGFGFFTLTNCTNVSITNCDIDSRTGIVSLNNCNGVILNDNVFRNASSTVGMTNGSDLTIQGNEFIACGGTGTGNWSVRLVNVAAASTGTMNRVSWDNNSFDQCLNGIEIAGMPNATISSTGTPEFKIDFEDRLFSSGAIILRLSGSPNSSITDMDCTNRASAQVAFKLAVSVINSADVTLDNLTFARYNNPVSLFGATNCTITNSLFKCNNVGIDLGTSSNLGTTINANNFDDNTFAIRNNNSETYDASNNYWGAADGSSTDGGSGDAYQGNLTTTPFATTAFPGLPLLNPEIDITGNGNAITDGQTGTSATDNTLFADTPEGQTTMNTFTIANTESDPLTVHSISSSTDDFEYTGSGFIVPGNSSVNVDINFSPTSTGNKSAIISVENDDCDEVSYTFQVSGLATATPEINLTGQGIDIPSGNTAIDANDDTNFGDIDAASGADTHTFTIENTGGGNLTITNISIDNTTDFAVTQAVSSTVTGGGNTTFTVTFDPVSVGAKTGTVTIANNDGDEGTYTFVVGGNGTGPIESAQSGLWSDPTTWVGGVVPDTGDDAIIKVGHAVLILNAVTFNCNNLTIENTGSLDFSGLSSTLNNSGVIINNGSINMYNDGNIIGNGGIVNNGDITITSQGGNFDVHFESNITNNGIINSVLPVKSNNGISIDNFGSIQSGNYDANITVVNKNGGDITIDAASNNVLRFFAPLTNEAGGTLEAIQGTIDFDVFSNAGNLIVQNGGSFLCRNGGTIDVTNMDVQAGGNFTFQFPTNAITLIGSPFTNNGFINATGGTITLNHTAKQVINGNGQINRARIDNASNVEFPDGHSFGTFFSFLNGKVEISGAGDVVMNTAISAADETKYFITSSTGRLVQSLNSSASRFFPVGPNASSYNPVTLGKVDGSVGNTNHGVRVKVGTDNPLNDADFVNRQWTVERLFGSDAVDVTVQWNTPADETSSFDAASNSLSRWDGTQWVQSNVSAASCNNGVCTRMEAGFSDLGAFAVENAVSCDVAITSVATTDESCLGANDGTVTINATCSSCTAIQYSIDGGQNFQPSNTFNNVAPGTINAVAQDTGDSNCEDIDNTQSVGTTADNTDPTITCPANQTETADGNCDATFSDYTNLATASDNCGTANVTQDVTAGATFSATTTVTLTVTDGSTNTATCTFDVSINDNEAPMAVCQDVTVALDATGMASITTADVNNGSNDNCTDAANLTLALDNMSFDCNDVGGMPSPNLALEFDGTNENTSHPFHSSFDYSNGVTAEAWINATQWESQFWEGVLIQNEDFGGFILRSGAGKIDGMISFGAGIATPLATTTGNLNTNTWYHVAMTYDGQNLKVFVNGVEEASTAAVGTIVNPNSPPMFVGGSAVAGPRYFNGKMDEVRVWNYARSASEIQSTMNSKLTGGESGLIVYYPFDDGTGSATAVDLGPNGLNATLNNMDANTDWIGGVPGVPGSASGGSSEVILTVTDEAGNSSTCTANITVEDNTAPVIANCPSNMTVDNTAGLCTGTAAWTAPTASDNCNVASFSSSHTSGSVFSLGTTTVTYDATDDAGNAAVQCSFTITVNDTENPTISCPANITQSTDANSCDAVVNYTTPVGMDNCSGATTTMTAGLASGSVFPVGSTEVTYTVADAAGNGASCTFSVTIEDNTPPTLTCPADINMNTTLGSCNNFVVFNNPTITDNCGSSGTIDGLSFDSGLVIPYVSNFSSYLGLASLGVHVGTFTATDDNGVQGACSFTITITDNEFPVFTNCPTAPVTEEADFDDCAADVQWPVIFANDNCSYVLTSTHISGDNFQVGTTPVTFTATDEAGNATDCTFNVIVEDATPPLAVCQDLTVALDANGEYTLTAAEVNNESSDYCTAPADLGLAIDLSALTCAHLAAEQIVTLTVTDEAGNSATCTSRVTVVDNIAPSAVCQAHTVVLDASGNGSIVIADIDGGSGDNCTFTLSITAGQTTFSCADAGNDYTVTLTNVDESGNTATCDATVSVVDMQAPTITCPADISMGTDATICGAVVTWAAPVTSDNCPNVTVNSDANSGDTFPVGTTDVNYTVTDASGNQATCTFSVTIADDDAPNAVCQDVTVVLDANGDAAILPFAVDNGSSDNCAITTISVVPAVFDCSNLGANPVTLTVGDEAGNSSSCSATVTVEDNIAPTFTNCPSDIIQSNDTGSCDAIVTWTPPVADDNCSTTVGSSHNPGDTFPIGSTDVNYTVTDAAGNMATCTFSVTINDTEAPAITCPSNITSGTDAGVCGAVINYTAPVGTDNCAGAATAMTAGLASGVEFPVGETTVTYTVTDAANLTTSCSFTVTINDDELPVISGCPGNISQSNDNSFCDAVVTWTAPTASDNCSVVMVNDVPAGNVFPVGTTTVTYLATDPTGNAAACLFDVTVTDDEAPTIVCPADMTLDTDAGSCDAVVTYATPVGNDNCPSQTTTLVAGLASGATFPIGSTDITYSVTDAAGNAASCTFSVTVEDNEAPVINNCPQSTTVSNDAGQCGAAVSWTSPTVSDNCTGAILGAASQASGSTFPVGTTTVTYDAVDAAGNNAVQCSFTVTVEDTEAPIIACPANITQSNDLGSCDAVVTWAAPVNSDNCPNAVVTSSHSPGETFPLGTTDVGYTITDAAGNVTTCNFSVTIEDDELPVMACNDLTIELDANGNASITIAQVDAGSTDNCTASANLTFALDNTDFACAQLGNANTVTLTATDEANNSNTCTSTITVEDNVAPVVSNCPADMTVASLASGCAGSASWTEPTATDNCLSLTQTLDSGGLGIFQNGGQAFGTFPGGTTAITYTFTDGSQNESVCTFNITVEDNTPPSITGCPSNMTLDNAPGTCSAQALWQQPNISDNCPNMTYTASHISGSIMPIGTTTVTYVATDAAGNTATCSFDITVQDTEAPEIVCPTDAITAAAMGNCQFEVPDLNAILAPADNCDNSVTGAQSPAAGTMVSMPTSVAYSVVDAAGNTASCTISLEIPDAMTTSTTSTDASCPTTADGSASVSITGGTAPYTILWSNGANTQLIENVLPGNYDVDVTDANGCVSSASALVVGTDNEAPIADCENITIQLDETGMASILATDVSDDSSDNCGIDSYAVDIMDFDCSDVGNNDVILTVTDASGNSDNCTAVVTVEDPVGTLPAFCGTDYNVSLNANGEAVFMVAELGSHSDNCGTLTLFVIDAQILNCNDIGNANVVNIGILDNNGNFSSCNINVFVEDVTPPVALCQDVVVVLDNNGLASITATQLDDGSFDNCGLVSLTLDQSSFDCNNVGDNTVTMTATDNAGLTNTCTSVVTVENTITAAPAFCGSTMNFTIGSDGLKTLTPADFPSVFDNCGNPLQVLIPGQSTFNCSYIGVTVPVTLSILVGDGSYIVCSVNVTFEDNIAPTALCQDFTAVLDANGNAEISPSDIDGGSFDNCSIAAMFTSTTTLNCNDLGANTVTLFVTDSEAMTDNCTATVTVVDQTAPVANFCDQPVNMVLDANGNATMTINNLNGASDNCTANPTIQILGQTSFGCSDIGNSILVQASATDDAGNTTICDVKVNVKDVIAPVAICQNITIVADGSGVATLVPADVDNGSFDNCSIVNMTATPNVFNCGGNTDNDVILTVTDNGGLMASCTATVTVSGGSGTGLQANCQDVTVNLDENGQASITPNTVDNGSVGCGISLSVAPANFDCTNLGTNTVTLTAMDGTNTTATCTSVVTIVDNTAPTAICQDITVNLLGETWLATIAASDIDNGSSDVCSTPVLSASQTVFDCSNVGDNQVTLTVSDGSGNSATCTATVTVGHSAPVAVCQAGPIQLPLDDNGMAMVDPMQIDGGSFGVCNDLTFATSPSVFDCADAGTQSIVLSVTDELGQTSNCSTTVTVVDNSIPPPAFCNNTVQIDLDANGQATITTALGDHMDNCGTTPLTLLALTGDNLTCANAGSTVTVFMGMLDGAGNTSTCFTTVQVNDPTNACGGIPIMVNVPDTDVTEQATEKEDLKVTQSLEQDEATLKLTSIRNYPNPFSYQTKIEYTISAPAVVSIEVYNQAGQLVTELTQGAKNAGRHSVFWQPASGTPKGLYFAMIRLDDGTFKAIKLNYNR